VRKWQNLEFFDNNSGLHSPAHYVKHSYFSATAIITANPEESSLSSKTWVRLSNTAHQ